MLFDLTLLDHKGKMRHNIYSLLTKAKYSAKLV